MTASPDLTVTTATEPVPLPVTAVTCLEDRAHVERTATLQLEPGVQQVRLGPVSALAVDRSLHADLTRGPEGATVLDVRLVRAWTPRAPEPPTDSDSPLRRHVHALREELRSLERRGDRLDARLDALSRLAADLLREIGEGAGYGECEPERWSAELDRVDAERAAHEDDLGAVRARSTTLRSELRDAQHALHLSEEEPPELTAHVDVTVRSSAAGPAELRLGHLTPCALWRPAYRATLDGGQLTLQTDAMVWQRTGEDWTDVRLTLSTARSSQSTVPPRLVADRLTLRDRTAAERRTVDIEMRTESVSDVGPAPVPGLPGVDDGGEVRVLRASAPVSVPGDGHAHRVPLLTGSSPAQSEYVCAPELSPLVTQVVRFTNTSGHALLAGPVELMRGSGFTGRGMLEFTAPGAAQELAFGSVDTCRVTREDEDSRATTGLTQRTVTTHTVRLHVSRFSAPGEADDRVITLRERIPLSEVSQVEVRLRKESCSPAPDALDADGIARWDLSLPPGGRRTVTLVYEVSADSKVTGL
ncbi:mucoidy inhibitor MuiA family protein [Streptomyces sp. VRA16 Mangrove soil]|uniref:mucoidy inhibitor MuiA family protein n=1 Tax=Streptomyces sp. VRA16 Mangrove soil TaxID=2817434 RepID=UPI001A9CFC11|nr:mucoidy inhibitor MuiA family protein [Streptomyces sp. VRA16 Mangrove soil]MBO1330111.1 mucoidy inhibitor MuiA family protein [Streptomyces sp. VRA16 Mangrove soil]